METNFRPPRFYPIIDTAVLAAADVRAIDLTESVLRAGAGILQYRHKGTWTQVEFDEAKAVGKMCAEAGILFVVNDRADFAHLLAAGLHIGQDDLPPAAARRVVNQAILGFSTHNATQLWSAAAAPVDYLSLGPIFATKSKQKADPVVGIDNLRALRRLTAKPLVAIGGITLDNAPDVLAAGADSVAIIAGLLPLQSISDWCRL